MLTIFSTPKPFRGHIGVIQRNALKNWTLLHPDVEVILFGDEEGAAEACRDLGIRHMPAIERNEHGTKYLRSFFDPVQRVARHNLLCYANCDILFPRAFTSAVETLRAWRPDFVMVGRRWDVDLGEPWDFSSAGWSERLVQHALRAGVRKSQDWNDYFVFPRGLFTDLPPLVIGRVGWDNYLLWRARAAGVPLVDASEAVHAVHQNHDYAYHPQGQAGVWNDAQSQRNIDLAGGLAHIFTMDDATHRLTPAGIRTRPGWRVAPARRALRRAKTRAWFSLLSMTRPVRHALGLRQQNLKAQKDS